ncbi:hypothetical protein EDB89DRAFT_1966998 [Lactarius sanguifluus]|nr:hypothetical protein EDB89DRAFT_1966998 [Lactarius sanguifluus]
MPLEATMIILDNSEYMRNGDYQPSRFEALADAVKTVFSTKIDSNPENTVGVMTMANKGPEVLVTHTKEIGQILTAVHNTSTNLGRTASIPTAIAIAQLALKHRQNKNLRQRVIVFRALIRLAKKLKKNNVALDLIAFGDGIEEAGENGHSILRAFVEAASSSDNSHYLAVPPGSYLLSSVILDSPVLAGDRGVPDELGGVPGGAGASGSGGPSQFEFGVDPSLDPELAMALRMSMEEEAAPTTGSEGAPAQISQPAPAADDDEEALLQQALALSEGHSADVEMTEGGGDEELTEEEMIARAIEMSMNPETEEKKK